MKTKSFVLPALVAATLSGAGLYCLWYRAPAQVVTPGENRINYERRRGYDSSGSFIMALDPMTVTDPESLDEIHERYAGLSRRIDQLLATSPDEDRMMALVKKMQTRMYEGRVAEAAAVLEDARTLAKSDRDLAGAWLYTIIFWQGVASMRQGENENCLECRGDSACIYPLSASAIHTKPAGSRAAIRYFTEYLQRFPDDLAVVWLLNLAYMTLGEYPDKVPPQYRLPVDRFGKDDDIGRFRDISHLVDLNRRNMAGGAVMDDFDNDGLLDVVVTTWGAQGMGFFRNKGDGTFEDRTEAAGLAGQYAGSNLVQGDYDNDGFLDIFVMRGGWMPYPLRPTLLHNNGNGTFTDVTKQAGLMAPINTMAAQWADFDNDGRLDLFVCCERGPNHLYRNKGNGTFEDVTERAGVAGKEEVCKGAAWIDYDNDGYPDLFVTYMHSTPQLFHNNRDGTFTDVTSAMGIDGPFRGFSCWAFDYDNDGWLDIFATCYDGNLGDAVRGMMGQALDPDVGVTRLYRNVGGKMFRDVSKEVGLDKVYLTMGSNFADFDNDGYLDIYLGTGDPDYSTLVPNRMLRNVGGRRFVDITATSGTGHLQKGHGVACGDWDRDGNVDLFMDVGGAVPGDRYHNVLFQNPGHDNNWLTVKLIGKKTNRSAIGARIKVVTAGENPLTVHRLVSSGSSFGGNPLQQTIGLGKAASVARLEITWPTSGTTQVFRDVSVNQTLEITEFAEEYRRLNWTRVPVPHE